MSGIPLFQADAKIKMFCSDRYAPHAGCLRIPGLPCGYTDYGESDVTGKTEMLGAAAAVPGEYDGQETVIFILDKGSCGDEFQQHL